MVIIWISIALLLPYAILILMYRRAWASLKTFRVNDPKQIPTAGISVIIPARNEGKHIGTCLSSVIAQEYPAGLFEIIVVDDFSSDETVPIVEGYLDRGVKLVHMRDAEGMDEQTSSKKKAIDRGISIARHSLIVTTDADCTAPPLWLKCMGLFHEQSKLSFIAAPVRFQEAHNMLHIFQALDFLALQGITAAASSMGLHAMSNGANLAYEKKIYQEVGGFSGVDHIASGDDMLLMQKFTARDTRSVGYCFSPDAIVRTEAAENWTDFIRQRIRWASKAIHYRETTIFFVLLLVYLLNVSLLAILIMGMWIHPMLGWWLVIVFSKAIIELNFLLPVSRFFSVQKLLWFFIPMQPFHILYTVAAGTFSQFRRYEWKGRKVK